MANNDKILVDGIIDDRIDLGIPSNRRDEVFEYFSIEQILKDYAFSQKEILGGVVDGKDDGGIDAIYIIVNGHLITDIDSFLWPKSGCELDVFIVTCKHRDTFKMAPLDSLIASITELLNFGLEQEKLLGDYNEEVITARNLLIKSYRKVSTRLQSFNLKVFYASRGDSSIVGDNILARSNQLIQIIDNYFSNVKSEFKFFGAKELIEAFRKSKIYSYDLTFHDLMSKEHTYLVLVHLKDYYDFISDDHKLKRYFFDSNVRSFMGLNNVNKDIQSTLNQIDSPDFWWLNNGITILTTKAVVIGNQITLENVQIVNGLQTTESVFRYFKKNGKDSESRSILIKIIVSNDKQIRDQIIRATNNQTAVEQIALHATDKIQRDIEDILLKHNFYYERRTNHYLNQGINPLIILSPLYLAGGYVSLILKMPWTGANFKSKHLRNRDIYDIIFVNTDINVWPQIAKLLKKTDSFIESTRPKKKMQDHYLRRYRHLISFMILSKELGTMNFEVTHFLNVNIDDIKLESYEKIWNFLKINDLFISSVRNSKKKTSMLHRLDLFSKKFGIEGYERVKEVEPNFSHIFLLKQVKITEDFIEKVRAILPEQPWKENMYSEIMTQLDCSHTKLKAAILVLVERGIFLKQKDGVLYNKDGSVNSFDTDRVDLQTMKLIE